MIVGQLRSGPLVLAAGSALDSGPMELIQAAAGAGFDAVGLRLSHGRMPSPREITDVYRRANDLGVFIHDIEVHRIGEGTDVGPLIEAASTLGAAWLLVVSDLSEEAATIDEIARIGASARSAGVEIGLEYMAWTTPSDPGAALRVAQTADCSIVVDVLHHHRVGAGVLEMRDLVSSRRLGWVQLCDAPLSAPDDLVHEARHDRLTPGTGRLPLAALMGLIPDGIAVSVEVQSDALARSMTPAQRAVHLAAAALPYLGVSGTGLT